MNCPKCNNELKNVIYESIEIDICKNCKGVWFDRGELHEHISNLITNNEVKTPTVKQILNKPISTDEVKENVKKCPKCFVDMYIFNFCYDSNVILDKCPSCQGIWSDKGEVRRAARFIKGNPKVNEYAKSLYKAYAINFRIRSKTYRYIAIGVSCFYIVLTALIGGLVGLVYCLGFLCFTLSLIFFSEELGSLTGIRFGRLGGPVITKKTPGIFIELFGWFFLLFPMIKILKILIYILFK